MYFKTNNKKGFTIIELLVTLTIFSLLIALGVPGFKSFSKQVKITNSIRTVTLALTTARYKAIDDNRSIKLKVENNKLVLLKKRNNTWEAFMNFDPGDNAAVTINTSPVFSPEGYITPLCSIYINCFEAKHKVTVSLAGRLKVTEL
jgi:prepilin-type N-terminal cleavage/methylation domain-containing protein